MGETTKYFVVKQKAIPEVLLKVVEAKRLLESEKVLTIQEAVDAVGISRSSFYKYKDDIFQFHDKPDNTFRKRTYLCGSGSFRRSRRYGAFCICRSNVSW